MSQRQQPTRPARAEPPSQPPLPPSTFSATNESDHIKILLATDNHIGYMERDPVRGQDSINTFHEILQLAVQHDVDMILLGGDLFHENKPSRATLHQVMALLRQYTLGDKPIQIELLSDPHDGALPGTDFPTINYEDSNLNVSIPVFSIHGNHDDPQGSGQAGALSALDILSVSGLINYFGKIELPSDDSVAGASSSHAAKGGGFHEKGIRIKPVLVQKGSTRLALYGMGNIKDERMHFELRANRVRMFRPQEDPDSWFNILCVHQNRAAHTPKAYVPESMFDDSIHLVVWGHEHQQRIQPEPVTEKRYHITQPGSSVATSLSPGEAVEKCVAIVHVENTDFLIEPIPLKSVRPFVLDDMVLAEELEEHGLESKRENIMKLLRSRVNELIQRAKEEYAERHPDREMPLPLLRLRVEYTNQEISNPQRFGQEFVGKVANPRDVLQFTKKKSGAGSKNKHSMTAFVDPTDTDLLPSEKLQKVDVGLLVQEYLQAQNLDILNPEGLESAVLNFVEKDDRDAIDSFVTKMLRNTVKGLVTIDPEEEQIQNELERLRQEQERNRPRQAQDDDDEATEPSATVAARRPRETQKGFDSDDSMMEELQSGAPDDFDQSDEGEGDSPEKTRPRGTSNRAGRGKSTTARTASGPTGAKASGSRVTTARKSDAPPSRRAAATAAKKIFLGNSEDEDQDDSGSDVVIDEAASTPAPASTTGRHAAALGMTAGRSSTSTAARAKAPARKRTGPSSSPTKAQTPGLRQSQLAFAPAPAPAPTSTASTRTRASTSHSKMQAAAVREGVGGEDDEDEFVDPEPRPTRSTRSRR